MVRRGRIQSPLLGWPLAGSRRGRPPGIQLWMERSRPSCNSQSARVVRGRLLDVGFEDTTAAVASGDPTEYDLRVTMIFRREQGQWKIVHRHADPIPGSGGTERQVRLVDAALTSHAGREDGATS